MREMSVNKFLSGFNAAVEELHEKVSVALLESVVDAWSR